MRTRDDIARCAPLLLAGSAAFGCMSLDHALVSEEPLSMYGGTESSVHYITGEADEETSVGGKVFRAIDLPFTIVMDTLLLPISAPVELARGDDDGDELR